MNHDLPQLIKDSQGNDQMHFTSVHMEKWVDLGLIPKHLSDGFYADLMNAKRRREKILEYKSKNPNATSEKVLVAVHPHRVLSEEEAQQSRQEAQMQIELTDLMVQNWDLLASVVVKQDKKPLYKGIRHPEKQFGVARIETDCVYHLRDLLDEMEAMHVVDNEYIARGEIKNSNGLSVILQFELKAKNQKQADEVVSHYKKMMVSKGLRAFLAYWKAANEAGGLTFERSISEIMGFLAAEDRSSYQCDKDRSDFWAITRTLAATKFMMEWPARKSAGRPRRGKKGPKMEWVEQPLLQIHGGEKELGEDCPIRLRATVLTAESAKRRFLPAVMASQTLRLHPADVFFAVVIQSRAAQMRNGEKIISFDWDFAFRASNLTGTARTNRRAAKVKVRKKLVDFRDRDIIEEFTEDVAKIHVQPQKTKKIGPQIEKQKCT